MTKVIFLLQKGELMLEKITVFDVETPSRRNDRICAIGLVRIENGAVVDRKCSLVDPQCEFDAVNIEVHGIKETDVIGAPTFAELWNEIEPWFLDGAVAVHNAHFDISVLRKTLKAYGLPFPKLRYMDTMVLAPEFWPDLPDRKLDSVCSYLGISLDHHNAGSDAAATAEIVLKMLSSGLTDKQALKTAAASESDSDSTTVLESDRARSAAIRQLRSVMSEVVKDGELTEEEYVTLHTWIMQKTFLAGTFPYDDVYQKMEEIDFNGITPQGLDELGGLCVRLLNPVKFFSDAAGSIDVSGKNVVLTGDFQHGGETRINELITSMGGVIQPRVTHATDIVLVGALGSDYWITNNYGRKIQYAMELQAKGLNIRIVPEKAVLGEMPKKRSNSSSAAVTAPKPQRVASSHVSLSDKRKKEWRFAGSFFRILFGIVTIMIAFAMLSEPRSVTGFIVSFLIGLVLLFFPIIRRFLSYRK